MKKDRKIILWVGVILLWQSLFIRAAVAGAFSPAPSSPVALKQHPRLHITPANIAEMRQKMANQNKAEYQKLVDLVVKDFSLNVLNEDVGSGVSADYHALIYLLGNIPGINYGGKSLDDFGQRAVEIMLNFVAAPVDCGTVNSSKVENFHGSGENFGIIATAYDWAWNYPGFTQTQKQTIANWLAHAGLCLSRPTGIMSSSYHEKYRFPWYIGLAFYGDGFADADALVIVNKFEQHMLNGGPLDALNFVAQKNGGPSEIAAYAYGNHGARHAYFLNGWRTATGADYFMQGTSIAESYYTRYYPKFAAYISSPWNAGKWLKWGQMSVNDGFGTDASLHINLLTGVFKNTDPNVSGLARWLATRNGGDGRTYPTPALLLLNSLMSDLGLLPKTPQQLGFSLTEYFAGLGMVFVRSGFENKDDLALVIGGAPYRYEGHSWDKNMDVPVGFQLDKYGGPLLFKKVAYHRNHGSTHRINIMRFNDPATVSTDLGGGVANFTLEGEDIRVLNPSHPTYLGGVERYLPLAGGRVDYIYTDLKRYYESSRVSSYSRQYVLVRPSSAMQSDYIVIFDRVQTPQPDIIKRWEINMAYDPVINGAATLLREGKTAYANANQITVSNNLPDPYYTQNPAINAQAHGRAFVKTLLPKQVKIEKVGGLNHEFERDTGEAAPFSDLDNYLIEYGAFYVGAYTVDVIAAQNNAKENFLHVIQTADANTTSSMVTTSLIESSEGKMQGVFIGGTAGQDNTVTMFAVNEEVLDLANQAVTYKYGAGTSGTTRHIISDLKGRTSYTITDKNLSSGSTTTQTILVSDLRTDFAKEAGEFVAGTLIFNTNISGEHQITIAQHGASVNFPPSATLITDHVSYLPSSSIIMTALITDQDGTISKVEFYNGATLLNLDSTFPYTFTWTAVPTGNYTLTAKAYDNTNAATVSNPVNIVVGISADITPPAAAITSPRNNFIIGPAAITISADAADISGVVSVDFKLDGTLIGTDSTSPYSIVWTPPHNLTEGNHILTVEARDPAGNKGISANVTVLYSPTGTNRLPIGNFDGITVTATKILLRGWTYDPDNSSVSNDAQLYIDGPKGIGTLIMDRDTNLNSPDVTETFGITGAHRFELDKLADIYKDGKPHNIYAYGIDLNDPTKFAELIGSPKVFDSSAIDVTPPTISITSPASGSTLTGNATITADAVDSVGVSGVQFIVDGANIGSEDTTAPYSVSWNSATAANGLHNLTAVARDISGNQAASAAVSITTSNLIVIPPAQPPGTTTNNLPTGDFEEITAGGMIRGWTIDPDRVNTGNHVQIYFGGPAGGGGTLVAGYRTNILRADINTTYSASDLHGFEYVIPTEYRDGVTRSVYVYGKDINDSTITLLSGSPKSFTLNASSSADTILPTPTAATLETAFTHFKLNNKTNNSVVTDDGSGLNHATVFHNVSSNLSTTGKISNGFLFDGNMNDYCVDTTAVGGKIAADSVGSLSFWVKDVKSAHFLMTLSKAGDQFAGIYAGPYYVAMVVDNGDSLIFRYAQNETGLLNNGQWHHAAVVQDGIALKIYIDGVNQPLVGANKIPGAWFDDLIAGYGRSSIGCRLSASGLMDHYFDGKTDELRYYKKALSANEVMALYNNGTGTEEKNPSVSGADAPSIPPADTTQPNVAITSPIYGSAVSSTINVTAAATDNVGVDGMQFKLDGNNLGAEDTTAPYSISWDTTTAETGTHSLTAVARDSSGNTKTSSSISVAVSNVMTTPTPPKTSTTLETAYTHFKLNNKASNSVVTDDGSGANHASVFFSSTANLSTTGKINSGFLFDGNMSGNCVDTTNAGRQIASDSIGSLSFWLKDIKSAHFLMTLGKAGDQFAGIFAGPYYVAMIVDNGDALIFRYAQNETGLFNNGQWHHAAIVQDGSALKIYIDGIDQPLVGSNKVPSAWFDDLTAGYGRSGLGCRLSANGTKDHFFDGKSDDFRYYKKALSANEVKALYNNGNGTEEKNPNVP